MEPISIGILIVVLAMIVLGAVLFSAQLISRRQQQIGSEGATIPVNLASVNDGVLVARIGGQITFVNEVARSWFKLEGGSPDLWVLSQKVVPAESFLELFAAEGQANFSIDDRSIRASSHRVAVGDLTQFMVVLREEVPLPTLQREERGSGRALLVLADVNRTIHASLDLEETLTAILDGLSRLIPFDIGQISLLDPDRDRLRPVRRIGPDNYVLALQSEDLFYRMEDGFTGFVARRRYPTLIADMLTDPDAPRPAEGAPAYGSAIGVPLNVRNRFIGVLEIASRQANRFNREDLSLVNLVAEQAAIAIDNARQYNVQAERVAELSGLQKIAGAISALQDPYQLYQQLTQRVADLMETEMAGILLYDRERTSLVAQKPIYGIADSLVTRYAISLERGSPARSLWEDVSFWFSNNVGEDHLVAELDLAMLSEMTGVRTTAMGVMKVGEERIGVVQISNKRNGLPFSLEDIRLLQIYADQVAIVVESARLYSQGQSRVAELEGLQQITQAISAFTNPDELYSQLTQRIAELMDVRVCGILNFDSEEERLVARKPFFGIRDDLVGAHIIQVGRRGFAREVWREHEIFVSNHVITDEDVDRLGMRDIAREATLQTTMLAPLSAGGRRFGMLQVANKVDGTDFDDDDRRLISIFAGQVATLIENARLYQDTDATLRKRAAELRSVSRISSELNTTLELERILEVIASEARRAEGATASSVVLFAIDDRDDIIPYMRFGTQVNEAQSKILEKAAARSNETVFVEDFEKVAHFPSPIPGARSALIVPIQFEGNVVGAIGLYSDRPNGLGSSAAEYIQALSSQATSAVTNATRHTEQMERSDLLRRRAEQLTQIFELGRMFRSDQSVEDNLNGVVRAVRESVGFQTVLISIEDVDDTLRHGAQIGMTSATFNKIARLRIDPSALGPYLVDDYRISASYLLPASDSEAYREALGLPYRAPDPNDEPSPGRWQDGEVLFAPLRSSSGELIGLLTVDHPSDGQSPSRTTIELLEIFANQAAIIIENSRLYRSVEERAEELSRSFADLEKSYSELDKLSHEMIRKDAELSQANDLLRTRAQRLLALHRVMESVDTTHSPENVLKQIARSVVNEMDVDQCLIALDEKTIHRAEGMPSLRIVAAEGRVPEGVDLVHLLTEQDPIARARATGDSILVAAGDGGVPTTSRLAQTIGTQTMVALPMQLAPDEYGVLMVGSTRPGSAFNEDDRDLFTLLSSQVAIEYENARLYQAVQAEAETASAERDRLQQLHLITTALQQTTSLEDRIAVVARGVRSVGWEKVAVVLYDNAMEIRQIATAGYSAEDERNLPLTLIPGNTWKQRFDDSQLITARLGSSYFFPADHPWVAGRSGSPEQNGRPLPPGNGSSRLWHPGDQLYMPMYAGTEIIGMINLREPVSGYRPGDAALRPLELFVQQASSALENIRLYQETRELQSYNEAILESIQQGIVVVDENINIESVNSHIRTEYGWDDSQIGKSLFIWMPRLREGGLTESLFAEVRAGKPVDIANVPFSLGTRERTLNIYLYPRRDEAGTVTGAVILLEDITQRAKLEADIALRGQQLAALNEASRAITATLSFGSVLDSALEQSKNIIAFDRLAIWIYNSGLHSLELNTMVGYDEDEIRSVSIELDSPSASLYRRLAEEREPVLITDTHDDRVMGAGHYFRARTWMGAPMLSGGNFIGLIVFEKMPPDGYAAADVQVASAFANQVGVALENARLFEEVAENATELASRTQRLGLLNRISTSIGRSLDEGFILQTALTELAQEFDVKQGSILLFDTGSQTAELRYEFPPRPDKTVDVFSIPMYIDSVYDQVRTTGSSMAVYDVSTDPSTEMIVDQLTYRRIRSLLITPIIVGNSVIGVLCIEETERNRRFEVEQIELGQTVTNQTAVSVQNARLYAETVTRQRELSLLFEASRIASASLDLDTVSNNAAEYFIRALNVEGAMVSLWDQDNDALLALSIYTNENGAQKAPMGQHRYDLRSYPAVASTVKERGAVVLRAEDKALSDKERQWLAERGIETMMMMPLVTRDIAIGVVEMWATDSSRRFTQSDIKLARTLATSFATAMENARLHVETERRLKELGLINDISRALSQTISAEDLYKILQEQLTTILKAKAITIVRSDRDTGQLHFPLVIRDGLRIHVPPATPDDNLYTYVLLTGQSLIIPRNVQSFLDENEISHPEEGLKSFVGVPLITGEGVIGVMAAERYGSEESFDSADLRVMEPIAAQVAVSIENTRLYSALEQRLSETTTLQEVSRVVNSALDLKEIFTRVVNELANAFEYPLIGLYIVEEDQLVLQAHQGYSESSLETRRVVSVSEGVIGRVVESVQGQLIFDVSLDQDYIHHVDWVTSMVAVPILSDEAVLGVLAVESGEQRPLGKNDLQLLTTFAGQVSTAMVNARLYSQMVNLSEELERRVDDRTAELKAERDRIDTLFRITVELTASLDLDRVLNRALHLVGEAIGAEHGSLFLIDPQSDRLIYRAAMSDFEILPPGGKQITLTRHEGMAGWVMNTREPLIVDNVQIDPRWSNVPGTENRRSLLGAPLIANEEVLGCLFFNSDLEGAFNEGHMQLVEAAANQVATSINNAELYRLISEQAERLGVMLRSQQTEAAKSQAILESIADGVMVADSTGEIILFNAASERILALPRDEVLGRPAGDLPGLYGIGGGHSWAEMLKTWSENATDQTVDFITEQIEIGSRFVAISVSPVRHGNEFLGMVSVFRDITREVASDRAKSEFVARVSHELRTPMTSIKGYADLLLMGAAGQISPEQKSFIDKIKNNADRLSLIVNDLLDISRIEQAALALDIRRISVVEILEERAKAIKGRRDADARNLDIVVEVPADDPLLIEADIDRINQIIINLVNNAYNYTLDGGSVSMHARRSNDGVQIDIVDTGIGISEKDKMHVFDRFFRSEAHPVVFQTPGTGLGLAIVQQLIDMHRGTIWFESEEGVGTTFSLWLPEKHPIHADQAALN